MKEPFKLDLLACINALDRCEAANEEESGEGGERAGAVIDVLDRAQKAEARVAELEAELAAKAPPDGAGDAVAPPATDHAHELGSCGHCDSKDGGK